MGQRRLPADPHNALQTYVSLLRRVTGPAGNVSITRHSAGYRATVDEDAVDVHRFRRLVSQARETGDDDRAVDLLEDALRLWYGEPFVHLDTPWINSARETLASQHQAARLDLFDLQLRLGRHAAVAAELPGLAAEFPLDERMAGQLMTAMYRCGRQADALAHYQEVRDRLAGELGIDPGPPLRRLHQQILSADPGLAQSVLLRPGTGRTGLASRRRDDQPGRAPARPRRTRRQGSFPIPRQLPSDVPAFHRQGAVPDRPGPAA